jgi:hypothetical protein
MMHMLKCQNFHDLPLPRDLANTPKTHTRQWFSKFLFKEWNCWFFKGSEERTILYINVMLDTVHRMITSLAYDAVGLRVIRTA